MMFYVIVNMNIFQNIFERIYIFLTYFDKSLIFQGIKTVFIVNFVIFINVRSCESVDFSMFFRTHYRTRKIKFSCENIRYAWFSCRTSVLKCNLSPTIYRTYVYKYTIIVQYYTIFQGQVAFCSFLQLIISGKNPSI